MDQVSALLSNILTIEESPSPSSSNSLPLQLQLQLQIPLKRNSLEAEAVTEPITAMGEMSKKPQRRSMDLDFYSFWKKEDQKQQQLQLQLQQQQQQLGSTGTSQQNSVNLSSTNLKASATAAAATGSSSSTSHDKAVLSSATSSAQYMADKLMEKVISVMIGNEIVDDQTNKVLQERMKMQKQRPSLSIALMQSNSNELHQRNANMYIFIDHVEKFFSWQDKYYTVGLLLIITHLILNPYLLSIVPFVQLIVTTFVPHYLTIYPPDGNFNSRYMVLNPIPSNRPLNTYSIPKPAPLFSREFFMNLTDTQNFMTLNIKLYDFGVWLTSDYLYFKNEQVTSVIYLICVGLIFANLYFLPIVVPFLLNHFIIVKLMLVFDVWALTIILHPTIRGSILEWIYKEDTRLNIQHFVNRIEDSFTQYLVRTPTVDQATFELAPDNDTKMVEIYELQRMNTRTKIWELIGFSPNFYTTNLVVRRYNNAIFELEKQHDDLQQQEDDAKLLNLHKRDTLTEINPPTGYKFLDSENWKIDYNITAWVEGNLIQDLVIIDDDEKWAYDILKQDDDDNDEKEKEKGEDKDEDEDEYKVNDIITGNQTINELTLDQIDKLANKKDLYRRRRWIRKVVRVNYRDKKEQQTNVSTGITYWV